MFTSRAQALQRYLHPTVFTVGLLDVKAFRRASDTQKLRSVYAMQQWLMKKQNTFTNIITGLWQKK